MSDYKLTEGSIIHKLIKLTLPIMGTSFVQMAYNLTDMFWIGFIGSKAVAAVGIAGYFPWLAMAFVLLSRTGTEIRVAQHHGGERYESAKRTAAVGITLTAVIAILYTLVIYAFRMPLIGFFNTNDSAVDAMSEAYLTIVCVGFIALFLNQMFTGLFTATGNSRTPFVFNVIGLAINMVLDPLLILGWGSFQGIGVKGAAIATVIAQFVVFILFLYAILIRKLLMKDMKLITRCHTYEVRELFELGFPPAVQSGLFTLISMVIGRIVADFGPTPIAVQKVGSQIESISWMTASGFSVALSAFVGQNFGAGKLDRVKESFKRSMQIAMWLGVFNTLLLYFGAKWLFEIFIREPEAVAYGIDYLRILALSQLFMCVEITASGIFNGLGHTKPPAIYGVGFNLFRIPMAFAFIYLGMGINGVWWSITVSSIFKGLLAFAWLYITLKKRPLHAAA